MIFRRVDADNDWTFGNGKAAYANTEEAIDLNIRTRLLSWVGDCFFAPDEGVDWRSRLDVGQQDATVQEVKTIILQSFGIVGVNDAPSVSFEPTQRRLSVTYSIQTIYSSSFQNTFSQVLGV